MSNVVEQLTPNPVNHEHGENGCCKNPRAWEMEMMHQVWAAGLHDAANCFQNALEAKWKLESQRKVKPKSNSDRIRAMTDEELAKNRCFQGYRWKQYALGAEKEPLVQILAEQKRQEDWRIVEMPGNIEQEG